MKVKYAVPPIDKPIFGLTIGQQYKVKEIDDIAFELTNDEGVKLYCLYRKCAHLDKGDWEIITVDAPDVTPQIGVAAVDSSFYLKGEAAIIIKEDGSIFWKGREVESDDEFKAAMQILGVIGWILAIVLMAFLGLAADSGKPQEPKSKYKEEPYTLSNGTPCVIIHGGSHSEMVGVTCNYQAKKSPTLVKE